MIGALIGGLISGAGSLLSGLGAKESAEDQQARQEVYDAQARERVKDVTEEYRLKVPKWLISDADKAGFNPVTWLQGGALGWYGTQLTGLVNTFGNATQAVNIPSTMSAIGGAISSGYGAFAQAYQFDRKMALEDAFLGLQQSRFTPGSAGPAHPYADRLAAASGLTRITAGPTASRGGGELSTRTDVTSPWKRIGYESDPYSPDAETVQRRSGNFWEEVGGFWNQVIADPVYNATGLSLTRGLGSASSWAVKTFGGTRPQPKDINDLFSGDPGRMWRSLSRNVPWSLRNPIGPGKGQQPNWQNFGGM